MQYMIPCFMPPSRSKSQFLFPLVYYFRLIFLLKSFCPATTAQMSEGDVQRADALIYLQFYIFTFSETLKDEFQTATQKSAEAEQI